MPKKKKRKFGRLHPLFVPQGIEKIVTLCGQIFGKVGKIERSLAAQAEGPYRYFICYVTGSEYANMVIELDHPIRSEEDIRAIEDNIVYVGNPPVISNFILLDK